jgi:hypothetical protein
MASTNYLFDTAASFIHHSNRSVFLTGKAGTGKTTFLRHIKATTGKQTVVVAPTGVAAINAGGVTIHSFFQLPFTPFIPGHASGFNTAGGGLNDSSSLLGRIKVQSDKRKIFQQLELLIIDEVSMVRCDVLDAIDVVLRHFRSRHSEPFGGVQVLLIGDMYQLPPVVPDTEWQLLSSYYQSPYFFSSHVMELSPITYVELDKVYRQSDEHFIAVLNQVRNNNLDEAGYELLHSRYQPGFKPRTAEQYITLTTHNHQANTINSSALEALPEKLFAIRATITGDFSDKAFPAEEVLQLKVGSQVMFIKNDTEKVRRYFNGKIGVVEKIETDTITVKCPNDAEAISVTKHTWENIRYSINRQKNVVDEEVVGSFEQFPLRLAWAITIHKSQGLTFEKAVIDAGAAFAPGQVYVALSRCTSLEGMVLLSRITTQSLRADERIAQFAAQHQTTALSTELAAAQQAYFKAIVLNVFQFTAEIKLLQAIQATIQEHVTAFNAETKDWLAATEHQLNHLQQVANNFQQHLQVLLQQDEAALQQRIKAAATYFEQHIATLIALLQQCPAVTDSKQYANAVNEDLKDLFVQVSLKQHIYVACANGFSVQQYHNAKQSFVPPYFSVNVYALAATYQRKDSPHPLLYKQLKALRDSLATDNKMPIYMVAGSQTLDEMVRYLPQTKEALLQINGFGKVKVENFGDDFLTIIQVYCKQHGLASQIQEKKQKRERKEKSTTPKVDTKLQSYQLYQAGKTVAEIAADRNLAHSTIEGHLAHYVTTGDIKATDLVSADKMTLVNNLLPSLTEVTATAIKEKLGDAISYSEIRIILAAQPTTSA